MVTNSALIALPPRARALELEKVRASRARALDLGKELASRAIAKARVSTRVHSARGRHTTFLVFWPSGTTMHHMAEHPLVRSWTLGQPRMPLVWTPYMTL